MPIVFIGFTGVVAWVTKGTILFPPMLVVGMMSVVGNSALFKYDRTGAEEYPRWVRYTVVTALLSTLATAIILPLVHLNVL